MKTTIKRWAGLGLSTAFLGTGVVACGSGEQNAAPVAEGQTAEVAQTAEEAEPTPEIQQSAALPSLEGGEGEGGEGEGGEGEGGETGHMVGALPLPQRLAFMSGHVEAGLALYRAGEPSMAAPHLLHPVSETHQAERAGIDSLGFDGALFEVVSKALEDGRPAAEIEPQLVAAEENLAMVAGKAGGDPVEVIRFLMDTIVEEYTIAITDGVVTDMGEYQDAYGFAIVALDRAKSMDTPPQTVISEIETLIGLWPEAPIPPESPAPIGQIVAQTSKVVLALPSSS